MLNDSERSYLESAPLGRLATADAEGCPHVVPVCFALVGERVVTPLDEKPQTVDPAELRRVQNLRANPWVALIVDHWASDWDDLGWVQLRGSAELLDPGGPGHGDAVAALRLKYDQYADHALEELPAIRIAPDSVRSWGQLDRPAGD